MSKQKLQSKNWQTKQVSQSSNQLTYQMRQGHQIAHVVQQQQILSQMGIDCWVSSKKLQSYVTISELLALLEDEQLNDEQQTQKITAIKLTTNQPSGDITKDNRTKNDEATSHTNNELIASVKLSTEVKEAKINAAKPFTQDAKIQESRLKASKLQESRLQESKLVVPFELQGVSFKNWVLLIDMAVITEHEQLLWDNICKALQLDIQSIKFPLVSNHNTIEVANAALTGFIFRLAKTETISIASLTTLPDGVTESRLTSLPTLKQMLGNPNYKQTFWQALKN